MSNQTQSLSNSEATFGEINEVKFHDNSNGTKYDSYPSKNKRPSVARLHVESKNEDVMSALEALESKLRLLQKKKDYSQKSGRQLSGQVELKLSVPELSWSQELVDAESNCHSLQDNLLEMLQIIHFEEKNDVIPKDSESVDGAVSHAVLVTKLKPQPLPTDHGIKGENNPIGTAKSCQTKVGEDSKVATSKLSKQPHYKLTTNQLPFILSGMTGKSFSLPVNIQLLVESLKSHNPWMCSLASDLAAMQKLVSEVEKDLKDGIVALRESIGYLTLESCAIRKQIKVSQDVQNQRVQEIMNRRDTLIAHMHNMDVLTKQLHHFKKQLGPSRAGPSATDLTIRRQTTNMDTHASKRTRTSVNPAKHPSRKMKTSGRQKNRDQYRPPWNDRVTPDAVPSHRPSVGTIKYRELLQIALKRNGYKLRERES